MSLEFGLEALRLGELGYKIPLSCYLFLNFPEKTGSRAYTAGFLHSPQFTSPIPFCFYTKTTLNYIFLFINNFAVFQSFLHLVHLFFSVPGQHRVLLYGNFGNRGVCLVTAYHGFSVCQKIHKTH